MSDWRGRGDLPRVAPPGLVCASATAHQSKVNPQRFFSTCPWLSMSSSFCSYSGEVVGVSSLRKSTDLSRSLRTSLKAALTSLFADLLTGVPVHVQ